MRKNLITMGLLSALGASTPVMAIDLDPAAASTAAGTADVFATDTIDTTNTVGATTVPLITLGGHDLIEDTEIGVGIGADDQNYFRVELTGASFAALATATVAAGSSGGPGVVNVIDGGNAGDSFVVFGVQAGATGVAQDAEFNLTSTTIGSDGSTAVAVELTQYSSQPGAVNEDASDELYSVAGTAITWGSTLKLDATDATSDDQTAEVSTNFLQFLDDTTATVGDTTTDASVGAIALDVTGALNTQNGSAATAADAADLTTGSSIVLTGDFSNGDWEWDDDGDCSATAQPFGWTSTGPSIATDKQSATLSGEDLSGLVGGQVFLCNTVNGTDEEIPESGYSYVIDLANATDTLAASDISGSLGTIDRNGTTVQLPYITTFADYNQRLVIVNRNSVDAAYSLSFTTEADVTATAGTMASGTVPAGEVLSINARDLVTITGKTRTAATLTVVAPSTSIDVATNQVNLEDGSTDTVVLN